jgi:hypothetical protein
MVRSRQNQVGMLAVTMLLTGAPAFAQAPGQPIPCSPPCGPAEMCVQGQCMVPAPPQDTTATPPPVAPAPLPEAAPATPPAGEVTEPEPAPLPRRKKARRAAVVEEDDVAVAWRRGVLFMPFAGVHTAQGIAADDYDAGARFGALVGVHATPILSLNVELAMDLLSPKTDAATDRGVDVSGRDFTVAFSPLFHASAGIGEFVVGPKLGYWSSGIDSKAPGFTTQQASQAGWAFGFNMGAFAGMTDAAAIGALVSYQMTYLSQTCVRDTAQDCTISVAAPQILSFNIAAIF